MSRIERLFALAFVPCGLATGTPHMRSEKPAIGMLEVAGGEPLQVDIFYETHCPYCKRFFAKSLAAVWNSTELRERIQLNLVPFGNAMAIPKNNISEGYQFWHADELSRPGIDTVIKCQHGADECFGNMMHACALKHLTQQVAVPLFTCMLGPRGNDASLEKVSYECAQEQRVEVDAVRACMIGAEGNTLMNKMAADTRKRRIPSAASGNRTHVPWITLNGAYSLEAEKDADEGFSGHFVHAICEALADPKPAACAKNIVVDAPPEPAVLAECGSNCPRRSGLPAWALVLLAALAPRAMDAFGFFA